MNSDVRASSKPNTSSGTVAPRITTLAAASNAVASKLAMVCCGPSVPSEMLVTGAGTLLSVVRLVGTTISSTTFFASGSRPRPLALVRW